MQIHPPFPGRPVAGLIAGACVSLALMLTGCGGGSVDDDADPQGLPAERTMTSAEPPPSETGGGTTLPKPPPPQPLPGRIGPCPKLVCGAPPKVGG